MTRNTGRSSYSLLLIALCLVFYGFISAGADSVAAGEKQEVLRIIVVGATGDLAAKYLWVACFRVALEAAVSRQQRVHIIAGARESKQAGQTWKERFFDNRWLARVCGPNETIERASEEEARVRCRAYFHDEFLPSVKYAALGNERQYAELSTQLEESANIRGDSSIEVGRLVYLAIPPKFFMQSCDLVNRYLRPHSPWAFLRVVIEKPFGNDFDSAVALAHDIREVLQDEEVLLMDHYAGKMGLRSITSFFERNQAVVAPIWNDQFIQSIDIHMTETETCEHRLEFFHEVGIIRDVMVNHLQLVLGSVTSPSCSGSSCQNDHLSFVQSMKQSGQLVFGQYDGYAHGDHELRETFAATAALIGFISVHDQWKQTRFTISAAKATQQRRLQVRVRFNQKTHGHEPSCEVRFVVQEGSGSSGERIELNCASFRRVSPPQGWEAAETGESTLFRPAVTHQEKKSWELGNTLSAYDFLLAEAVAGNHRHFMNLDQVLAAWKLWTPIVKAAEQVDPANPEHKDGIKQVVRYAIGADKWTHSSTTRAPSSHEDL